MHHGYGNLNKAIKLLEHEDRSDFLDYVDLIIHLIHISCLLQKKNYE